MSETSSFDKRNQETNNLWQQHKFFYRVLGGITLIGIGFLIGLWWFSSKREDYLLSLCTNFIAIAFGVFVVDQLARQREDARYKADLIYKMGSQVNHEAIRAIEESKRNGWLFDGSLCNVDLLGANLEGALLGLQVDLRKAKLGQANLKKATFANTNLEEAWLYGVNARGVTLVSANLRQANIADSNLYEALLMGSNFQNSNLHRADLEKSNLAGANLRGAYLGEANLQDAQLMNAEFDENTTLPDGRKWKLGEILDRFVDGQRSDFWRSENPSSPAFKGKKMKWFS